MLSSREREDFVIGALVEAANTGSAHTNVISHASHNFIMCATITARESQSTPNAPGYEQYLAPKPVCFKQLVTRRWPSAFRVDGTCGIPTNWWKFGRSLV